MSHLINRQGTELGPVESFADTLRFQIAASSTAVEEKIDRIRVNNGEVQVRVADRVHIWKEGERVTIQGSAAGYDGTYLVHDPVSTQQFYIKTLAGDTVTDRGNETFGNNDDAKASVSAILDGVSYWSEGGCDTDNTPLTNNDLKALEKETKTFVKLADGDTEELEAWNDGVYYSQDVTIYIYGKHARDDDNRNRIEQVRAYIDDWVFRRATNPDEEWTQSTPPHNPSSILHLGSYSIDWERIHDTTEDGITDYLEGNLSVRSQRCRS